MTNTTSVSGIPPAVVEKAKRFHINISEVCRTALTDEVEKMEKTGAKIRQDPTPDTPSSEAV